MNTCRNYQKNDKIVLRNSPMYCKRNMLRRIREEIGMTQSQLASLMGVSQPSIANLEKKGADIKLSTLHRYFDALGIEGTIQIKLPSGELRHIAI